MARPDASLAARLEAWQPTADDPWDRRKAAHLLRRAGFGATPERVESAIESGSRATIEALLAPAEDPLTARLEAMGDGLLRQRNIDRIAAWWLRLMLESANPLRERLALVWHGHFAVSATKVDRAEWIYGQLDLFRRHGAGDLRVLARGIVHDPAMLRFLDADRIRPGHPNENLARELFELFLLGIGNYTEGDIQEAARALTGLRLRRERSEWLERYHDASEKTIFGKTAAFTPDSLIDHCFAQNACARFFAETLGREFLAPDLDAEVIDALATRLRDEEFHVGRFLGWLFGTRMFYESDTIRSRISSPVEYAVGTLRCLEGRADTNALNLRLEAMGQRVFHPPGVQGWSGGPEWIASGRIVARNQFARSVATRDAALGVRYPWDDITAQHPGARLLDHLIDRLVAEDLAPEVREALGASGGEPSDWIHWLITLPETQLV